jgi:hypothetical protein
MTINRSANGARTNIPDYTASRPVNAAPAKGTGWAGYGASSRQRTEAARSHVDQNIGDLGDTWRNKINQSGNAPGGRTGASGPRESRRPQGEMKYANNPARHVFKREADSGRASGTRAQTQDISLPMIDATETEEVLAPSLASKKPAPQPVSRKVLAAVQKLIDEKYNDKKSPVYVQGLVYKRLNDPYRIELVGLTVAKKAVSEKLAKQYSSNPEGLRTALGALKSSEKKTLPFSDDAGWKNTRLNATIKKQGGNLQRLFKDMVSASAAVRVTQAPSLIHECIELIQKGNLKTVGIFRMTSDESKLDQMQYMLAEEPDLKAALRTDPDALALPILLKRMLKERPHAVVSGASKKEFLALSGESRPDAYDTAIGKLLPENRKILGNLMRALNAVAAQSEFNLMGADNLGTIFSSVLMEEEHDPMNELQRTTKFQPVVTYMIAHANELFADLNAAAPSPKEAASARVKAHVGAATLIKLKSTDDARPDGTNSTASTQGPMAPATSRASPVKAAVKKAPKQDSPARALASPLKAAKVGDVKKTYPNASLRNAQSAVDAANFIMTHAAQELGEDWRWEPANSPLRALVQGGIGNLRSARHDALYWTSRQDFRDKADKGQLGTWLKDGVAEVKKLKEAALGVEQNPDSTQADRAVARESYRKALSRFQNNQLDFTVLYAAEALTTGMAGKSIKTLQQVVSDFGKTREVDGTPMKAFKDFSAQEQQCLYDFYTGIGTLLHSISGRAAAGKEGILNVSNLINNLYVLGFAPLGETSEGYLMATVNAGKPAAAHVVAQKAQAIAIGLLTDPAKYFPKAVHG